MDADFRNVNDRDRIEEPSGEDTLGGGFLEDDLKSR